METMEKDLMLTVQRKDYPTDTITQRVEEWAYMLDIETKRLLRMSEDVLMRYIAHDRARGCNYILTSRKVKDGIYILE